MTVQWLRFAALIGGVVLGAVVALAAAFARNRTDGAGCVLFVVGAVAGFLVLVGLDGIDG